MKKVCLLISLLMLGGCATQIPTAIRQGPPVPVLLAEVRADSKRFEGAEVRWGGVIAKVNNQAAQTDIEIVSRALGSDGKPALEGFSDGRFIARFQGFVDPLVFSPGRQLTVAGILSGELTGKIGEFEYRYPVVNVTIFQLWPEPEPLRYYEYPYPPWYDDPWWPYPYPHHYPPYYW
ncbi:MAG: Slp family lipoprotein [Pseudomonadota bacterium]